MCRVPYLFGRLVIGVLLVGVAAPALAQTGRISGRVLDENGDPIPGAHIRAENPAASPPVRETDVEEDGRYAMIGFISGQWRVSVSADGYNEDFGTIGVTQSGTPAVSFELTKVRHALVQALGEDAMKGLDPDEIEQQLEAADSAFNARDWNAAVSQYQSLVEKLPMLTNLHTQIARRLSAFPASPNRSAPASSPPGSPGPPEAHSAGTSRPGRRCPPRASHTRSSL